MQNTHYVSTTIIFGNLVILLFLVVILGLATRGILIDDGRFAWGTFSYTVDYRIDYYWVYDNNTIVYHPGSELKGLSKKLLSTPSHPTTYKLGALLGVVKIYSKYVYENKKPENADKFQAKLSYRINNRGEYKTIIYEYP